jgi:hypothetical protein
MPRTRTPSPELTAQDKSIVAGAALTLRAVGERHRNEKLLLAAELADSFVDAPAVTPKPRTRKPKVALTAAEMAHAE